jgi:hypothetical protein
MSFRILIPSSNNRFQRDSWIVPMSQVFESKAKRCFTASELKDSSISPVFSTISISDHVTSRSYQEHIDGDESVYSDTCWITQSLSKFGCSIKCHLDRSSLELSSYRQNLHTPSSSTLSSSRCLLHRVRVQRSGVVRDTHFNIDKPS